MADELLDECEFWLPPKFLADDGDDSGLNLSSPVESVVEESDEDDFISGLTKDLARSSVLECNNTNTKGLRLSGSPQSTLCGILTNCSSRASSPPLPAEQTGKADGGAWDLLYAAAGDVARMKMVEESTKTGIWAHTPLNQLPQHQNYHELQISQFQRMKQNQGGKQGRNGRVGSVPTLNNNQQQNMCSWPTPNQSIQQPYRRSGMRAVFIGNPAAPKRESAGTGVFLPRTAGTIPSDSRKKSVCSTVLLPEKVVQALNLNLEAQPRFLQPRYGARFAHNYDVNGLRNQPRHNVRPSPAVSLSPELRLPQEWTY